MIIKFPTGLYDTVLPKKPSDVGNITYTVSNNAPPRSPVQLVVLPTAERLRKKTDLSHGLDSRRAVLGELIFTINNATKNVGGSGRKLFELGQFIEPGSDVSAIADNNTPNDFTIQHNTNILDLEDLGLSEEEINQINSASFSRKDQLEKQLTEVKLEIEQLKSKITENQKKINEVNKAISAVTFLIDSVGSGPLETLQNTKNDTEVEKVDLINQYDIKVAESQSIFNELLTVSDLVR